MGAVAQVVSNVVSSVGQAVTKAVSAIGKAVSGVVNFVGKTVNGIVQGALKNPLKTIATIGVIAATGGVGMAAAPWLAAINAVDVIAQGGNIGQALTSAALSFGSSWIGAQAIPAIGDALGSQALGQVAGGIIRGGTMAAVTGQDIFQGAALGGATAGIGYGLKDIGATVGAGLGLGAAMSTGAGQQVMETISGAIRGGLSSLAKGKSFELGAESGAGSALTGGLLGNLGRWGQDFYNENISPLFKETQASVDDFNTKREALEVEQKNLQATQSRIQKEQEEAENKTAAHNQNLAQFKALQEQLAPVMAAQDAAKASYDAIVANEKILQPYIDLDNERKAFAEKNDVDGQNRIIEQMNAMYAAHPEIGQALDQHAALSSDYTSKSDVLSKYMEDHKAQIEQYQALAPKLQTGYEEATKANTQLQASSDAANKQLQDFQSKEADLAKTQAHAQDLQNQILQREADARGISGLGAGDQVSALGSYAQSGTQTFDDGSKMTMLEDGSMLIEDAKGHLYAYDTNGGLHYSNDAQVADAGEQTPGQASTETPSSSGGTSTQAFNLGRFLQQSASALAKGASSAPRPASSRMAKASGMVAPGTSALPANLFEGPQTGSALEGSADQLAGSAIESEQDKGDLFAFMRAPASKRIFIEGVTDPAKRNDPGYLNLNPEVDVGGARARAQKAYVEQQGQQGVYTGSALTDPSLQENRELIDKAFSFDPSEHSSYSMADSGVSPAFEGIYAQGGEVHHTVPVKFYSEGGLRAVSSASSSSRSVKGPGDGTSDSILARLADSEYVIPADVVGALGNGSSDAGAKALDQMVKSVRTHKQSNGEELPPDALSPLSYLSLKGR